MLMGGQFGGNILHLKDWALIIPPVSTQGSCHSVACSGPKGLGAQEQNGNMSLSFIPFGVLQNYLNCGMKYLDNKINSVEITGQQGPKNCG